MIKHLALIMDGNRRWAQIKGLTAWYGHQEGAETIKHAIKFCLEKQIAYLSLYAFSLENMSRSEEEKNRIFELIVTNAQKRLQEFIDQGIRVRFVGDRQMFPAVVMGAVERLERETGHLTTLGLNILFCYGARQEIVSGVKALIGKVHNGLVAVEDITQESFKEYLWTGSIPDPEIVIRTGGFKRLSNFFLYQAAYSELFFLDVLWPDLKYEHLDEILKQFNNGKRNFGT